MKIFVNNQDVFCNINDNLKIVLQGTNFKKAIALKDENGEVYDATYTFVDSDNLKSFTPINFDDSLDSFLIYNHTCAHVLAAALKLMDPKVQLYVGPANDQGFYYDFVSLIEATKDLALVQKTMAKIIKTNARLHYRLLSNSEAKKLFNKEVYKRYLIEKIDGPIGVYSFGDYEEMCKGPHVDILNKCSQFKLLSVSGSQHDINGEIVHFTRIYGLCTDTNEKLIEKINLIELAKERDHKNLNKKINFFLFSEDIGKGFPLWLPNGEHVKNTLSRYIYDIEKEYGYLHVSTPVLGSRSLYKTSGHLDHYADDMFPEMILKDGDALYLRPMTCPHHIIIFKSQNFSYRNLPIRYSEEAALFRYEKSGALTGLERVRCMNLTDSHIFVREDQIEQECNSCLKLIKQVISDLNIEISYFRLSLRDEDNSKFYNNPQMWEDAENKLREILDKSGTKYVEAKGDAAFYGPKIDIQVKTILGHDITLATVQLDFLTASKFNATYVDENLRRVAPVMIHRGLIGTYERFTSILIEQYNGCFPLWLSPTPIVILPVNPKDHLDYANKVKDLLAGFNLNVIVDAEDERVGYKIRNYSISRANHILILGDQESKDQTITFQDWHTKENKTITQNEYLEIVRNLIKTKK